LLQFLCAKIWKKRPYTIFKFFLFIFYRKSIGFEEKSLHAQIPLQEKASRKIPLEENPSQQNASTLKYLPTKHL
jgi:hypothetical protein